MASEPTDWLLEVCGVEASAAPTVDEPWTCYRVLVDLLNRPEDDHAVQAARADMLAHPDVQALIAKAATWPGYALKRHNDAKHPIYAFSTLADFGVRASDPGMEEGITAIFAHYAPEGTFQTLSFIPKAFGGPNDDMWTWMACDAPTLLYILLAMGMGDDPRVQAALAHMVSLVNDNGWRCAAAPELGKFKGPGKRADPCPIANVLALKALAQAPAHQDSPASHVGTEMILWHWEHRKERKLFLFGMGTDFHKPKYPFVWYDILHVVDVLSRFPFVHPDPRFKEMVDALLDQADAEGRYTARSMYRAWKGWSFADKKNPSPWLTFLALRVLKRIGAL